MPKESICFLLPEMSESHDPKKIKKAVNGLRGIISVSVNSKSKKVAVDYDNSGTYGEEITNRITEIGFSPQIIDEQEHIM